MEPNKSDLVQETVPLDLDVVEDLERIVRRLNLGAGAGQVTLEAVFAEGSFMRGFIKRGPISAEQMRELGEPPLLRLPDPEPLTDEEADRLRAEWRRER